MGQGVQGAGFTGVGTTGKGDFKTFVIGALVNFGGAEHKRGLLAQAKDGILELHEISDVGDAEKGCGKRCRFRFSRASI